MESYSMLNYENGKWKKTTYRCYPLRFFLHVNFKTSHILMPIGVEYVPFIWWLKLFKRLPKRIKSENQKPSERIEIIDVTWPKSISHFS